MISGKYFVSLGFLYVVTIGFIDCQSRLLDPPSRSSAFRVDSRFPAYYNDIKMDCGGYDKLWNQNGGKCGICGEDVTTPSQFEKGGALYRGFIVRNYKEGDLIDVTVEITANHKGYFEFRVCNTDNLNGADANQACLDRTLLKDKSGNTRIPITPDIIGKNKFQVYLPKGFTCQHCVFQWRYNGGNFWDDGCLGCGKQPQIYGCSDISIGKSSKRGLEEFSGSYDEMEEKEVKSNDDVVVVDGKSLINLLKRYYLALEAREVQENLENQEKRYHQDLFEEERSERRIKRDLSKGHRSQKIKSS